MVMQNKMKIVIFDKRTKEVLAVVCTGDGDTSVCKNGIDFEIFSEDAEPIFTELNHKIYFNENKFLLQL